jgi:hypothetical protein
MTNHKNAPIFVVGTPRSGTTLTARILGRHSNIFMPGETPFFHDIYSRRNEIGELSCAEAKSTVAEQLLTLHARYNSPGTYQLVKEVFANENVKQYLYTGCESYEAIFSYFMGQLANSEGKKRWGNNVPNDIFYIDEIVSLYPDVKVLICARDLRDFLTSYQGKWRLESGENAERIQKLYHPLLTTLLWKSTMRRIPSVLSKVKNGNAMVIRYEDLTANPEKVARAVCETIEEEFEPEMLNVETSNSSALTRERGIYSSSVGRWKTLLDPTEATIAQHIAREELKKLNYSMEQLQTSPGKVLWILASFPFAAVRAVLANRRRRGPLVPYLISRLRSLLNLSASAK